jgi:hypothetical protein
MTASRASAVLNRAKAEPRRFYFTKKTLRKSAFLQKSLMQKHPFAPIRKTDSSISQKPES